MNRTLEEEKEYQSLSAMDKNRYDFEAKLDSSLTHKQIMLVVFSPRCSDPIWVFE